MIRVISNKIRKFISQPLPVVSVLLSLIPLILLVVDLKIKAENIAWSDTQNFIPYVLALRRGEFRVRDIFLNYNGQYSVTPLIVFTLTAVLTRWNILVEVALNVIVVAISVLCLAWIVRRTRPAILPYVFPAFSILMFSVHQDINWIGAFQGHWFYSNLWVLLAFILVIKYPKSWTALLGAGLLVFLAAMTSANGSIAGLSIGIYLLLRRSHNWKQLLLWGVATIAYVVFAYFMAERRLPQSSFSPVVLVVFALKYLGAAFMSRYWLGSAIDKGLVALIIGTLGVAVFFLNAAYLWFVKKDRQTAIIWLVPASYGGIAGLLIGLSRIPIGHTAIGPFIHWYSTMSNMFWVGYLALAFIVAWDAYHKESEANWHKVVGFGNILGLVGLLTLFIVQNHRVAETSYLTSDDPDDWGAGTPITDNCALEYVYSLEDECLAEWVFVPDLVAPYKLNVYAHQDPINILPSEYVPGEPIIVETERAWHAVHIRDWLLAGIPEEDVLFVFPEDAVDIANIPDELDNIIPEYRGDRVDELAKFLNSQPVVWYIRKESAPITAAGAIDALGFLRSAEYVHDPGRFVIVRYER